MLQINNIELNINKGALICAKIKDAYFSNRDWKFVFEKVSQIFSAIKAKVREVTSFKTEDELLMHIVEYSEQDLRDVNESGIANS